ncbi:MAG: RrF2 family transcriptional regulator [Calditrichia bacterium]
MILSKTCIYAIRAVLFTASYGGKEFVPIKRIAKELGISFHFLTKILQTLTQKGIMNSYRGPKGGVALAKPTENISIAEIVIAISGKEIFEECILGLPGCGEQQPCPLHEQWSDYRAGLQQMLAETTVAGLANKITSEGLRIEDVSKETKK